MRTRRIAMLMTLVGLIVAGTVAATAEDSTAADWKTTLKVKLELLQKLGTEALEIHVDTTNGAVHLTGDVEKRESKELAATIARSVDGVRSVDDDLELEAGGDGGEGLDEAREEVKDGILESRIRIALIDSLGTAGFKVGTEAASGVVLLEFDRESTRQQRDRAVRVVEAIDGVKVVKTTFKR